MRLLLRLKPLKDESFYSYTLRLASENRYESAKDIYRISGIKYRKSHPSILFKTANAKENIMAMIDGPNMSANLQIAWQLTTGNDKRKHKIEAFGDIISSNYFIAYKLRVCPHCIVETRYLRNYWELYHVTVCPIHSCMLMENCTTCGKAIGRHKDILERASCGHSWESMEAPSVVREFDALYSSMISNKIDGKKIDMNRFGFPNEFLELSLSELFAVVSTVVAVLPSEKHTNKFDVISSYSIETGHNILMEVISIFSNWPYNFKVWLSTIQDVIRKPVKKKVQLSSMPADSALMKLARNVSNNLDSAKFDFMKSVLSTFFAESWKGNIKLIKTIGIDHNERKLWSGWQITNEIGIDLKEQKRLVNSNIIIGEITPMKNGKNSIKIDVSSALNYKEMRRNSLSLKAAGEILGIFERAVLKLIEYKCVVLLRGPSVDGFKNWLIDLQSVQNVLDSITKNLLIRELDDELMIPFRYSWMVVGGTGYKPSLGRIVAEACSGNLRPCKITNEKGLNRFWFAKDDLKRVFAQEINEYKQQTLSCQEAASKLQTSKNALKALIKKGLIATVNSNGLYYCIEEDELQRFSKRYITLNEITKLTTTSCKNMRVYLNAYGVRPLFEDDKSEYLPYIYERNEELHRGLKEFTQKQDV